MGAQTQNLRKYVFDSKDNFAVTPQSVSFKDAWTLSWLGSGNAEFRSEDGGAPYLLVTLSGAPVELAFDDAPAKVRLNAALSSCRVEVQGSGKDISSTDYAGDYGKLVITPPPQSKRINTISFVAYHELTLVLRTLETASDVDDEFPPG